jgi:predicted DCC family thiol-disulfide oxidoreductase YuxK
MGNAQAIVVFDGECGLCNGFIAWLIRHDADGRFLITGSASEVGEAVVARAGLEPDITASTLLVWDGEAFLRSDAVIRVARALRWPWRAAISLRIVPRSWRDAVYTFVAARRPRVESADPSCGVPPPALVAQWRERLATLEDVA